MAVQCRLWIVPEVPEDEVILNIAGLFLCRCSLIDFTE